MNTKTVYGIKMSGIPLDGESLQIIPFSMIKELQTIICYDYEDGKPWHDLTCVMELVFNNDDFDDVTGKDIENNGKSIRYLYTHPWDLLRDFSKLIEEYNCDSMISVKMDLTAGWFQHSNKDKKSHFEDFEEFKCNIKHKNIFIRRIQRCRMIEMQKSFWSLCALCFINFNYKLYIHNMLC